MATNNFKAFALDSNANVMSQADWEALPALLSGFTAGKASSAQVNKAIRQATFIASAVAQFVSDALTQDVLDDGNSAAFITKLKQAIVNGSVPAGIPMPWPTATPPTGWLKCNGANFNTSTYPLLAKAYPSGKLPDLRGEFLRGWDDGRGVDSGRSLLSSQNGLSYDHRHYIPTTAGSGGDGLMTAVFTDNTTAITYYPSGTNEYNPNPSTGTILNTYSAKTTAGSDKFGDETRPRNVAFNYIVRTA